MTDETRFLSWDLPPEQPEPEPQPKKAKLSGEELILEGRKLHKKTGRPLHQCIKDLRKENE